jgi:hypothetical protein
VNNIEKMFHMFCGVALVFVGIVIGGVVFAEEDKEIEQDVSDLESFQGRIDEEKDTTFDFFGLRSGMNIVECRDVFRFNQEFLKSRAESSAFYRGVNKSRSTSLSALGSEESFNKHQFKEANGRIRYLYETESIDLVEMWLYFTDDGILWRLQANFREPYEGNSGLSTIYILAKYYALKAIFPKAEINMGVNDPTYARDNTVVVLVDPKVAVDAILKAKSEYIEDLKKAF